MFLSLFFVGCSQVPKPGSHQYSVQTKFEASEHWNIFARDIGNNITQAIKPEDSPYSSIAFIPNDNSPFCRAFRSYLATYLTQAEMTLKEIDTADYQLDWSVQTVTHDAVRKPAKDFPGSNTLVALLGVGIYKLFDDHSTAAGVIASGLLLDMAKEVYQYNSITLPKNEIIISVSLKKAGEYSHYRSTHTYYVNDMDADHYYTTKDYLGMDKKFNEKTFSVSD